MAEELNVTAKKTIKDFNDDEKKAIIERAKRIEPARVAKEFGTSWQVVSAIMRAEKKGTSRTKAKAQKEGKRATTRKAKTDGTVQKRNRGVKEAERSVILARASEIGVTAAAAEAGISKWTIFQWRKVMKKAGIELPAIPRAKGSRQKLAAKKEKTGETAAEKAVQAVKASVAARASKEAPKETKGKRASTKSAVNGSLEFENAMLKEQVSALTRKVEKLRAALAQLA